MFKGPSAQRVSNAAWRGLLVTKWRRRRRNLFH